MDMIVEVGDRDVLERPYTVGGGGLPPPPPRPWEEGAPSQPTPHSDPPPLPL